MKPPVEYQNPHHVGFIFAVGAGVVVLLISAIWTWKEGGINYERYAFAPGSRHPKAVLAWRSLICSFCLVEIWFQEDIWSVVYFTFFNWFGITLYLIISVLISFYRTFHPKMIPVSTVGEAGETIMVNPEASLTSFPARLVYAQHIMGQVLIPTAVFITAAEWVLLAPHSVKENGWDSVLNLTVVSEHLCNCIFMLPELFIAGYEFHPKHFCLCLMWSATYCLFHIVANQVWGILCYPFMQTNTSLSILICTLSYLNTILQFFIFRHAASFKRKWWHEGRLEASGYSEKKQTHHPQV